jgi:hypothetical protein
MKDFVFKTATVLPSGKLWVIEDPSVAEELWGGSPCRSSQNVHPFPKKFPHLSALHFHTPIKHLLPTHSSLFRVN